MSCFISIDGLSAAYAALSLAICHVAPHPHPPLCVERRCQLVCLLLSSADCREILLPLMTDQLKFHLDKEEEPRACCQLLSDILEVLYRKDVVRHAPFLSRGVLFFFYPPLGAQTEARSKEIEGPLGEDKAHFLCSYSAELHLIRVLLFIYLTALQALK